MRDTRPDKLIQLLNLTIDYLGVNRWLDYHSVLDGVTSVQDRTAPCTPMWAGVRAPVDFVNIDVTTREGKNRLTRLAEDVMGALSPKVLKAMRDGLDGRPLDRASVRPQFSVHSVDGDTAEITLVVTFTTGSRVGDVTTL